MWLIGIGVGLAQSRGNFWMLQDLTTLIFQFVFSECRDKWVWDVGGSVEFVVLKAHTFIDEINMSDGINMSFLK